MVLLINKNLRKQSFVYFFQKEQFTQLLSSTHSSLNHSLIILITTHSLDQSITQSLTHSINQSINISQSNTHTPTWNSKYCEKFSYLQLLVYRCTNWKIKNVEILSINWLVEKHRNGSFFHELLQMNASSQWSKWRSQQNKMK